MLIGDFYQFLLLCAVAYGLRGYLFGAIGKKRYFCGV